VTWTWVIIFTIVSFVVIVGGFMAAGRADAARRGEVFEVTQGNYLGCSLILWGLVMFWFAVIIAVVQALQ
jgi:hypothetical protein